MNASPLCTAAAACACLLAVAQNASAVTYSGSGTSHLGNPLAASIDFQILPGKLLAGMINTSTPTHNDSQLLTGVSFQVKDIDGLALYWAKGNQRLIWPDGSYADDPNPVDLLSAGPGGIPSWSFTYLGNDRYGLFYVPDPRLGLIGPPQTNDYADADGSIKGNPFTNPYLTAAIFKFDAELSAKSEICDLKFHFGTKFEDTIPGTCNGQGTPPPVIPEPASLALLPLALAALALRHRKP